VASGPVDFDGAPDRNRRLTRTIQPLAFMDLSADGRTLNVVAGLPGQGYAGYAIDAHTGTARLLFEREAAGEEAFAVAPDGKTLYVSGSGRLDAYDLGTGAVRAIALDTTAPHDYRAEMAYLFEHQWRFVQSKFYDTAGRRCATSTPSICPISLTGRISPSSWRNCRAS
jgi:tricorn protease